MNNYLFLYSRNPFCILISNFKGNDIDKEYVYNYFKNNYDYIIEVREIDLYDTYIINDFKEYILYIFIKHNESDYTMMRTDKNNNPLTIFQYHQIKEISIDNDNKYIIHKMKKPKDIKFKIN